MRAQADALGKVLTLLRGKCLRHNIREALESGGLCGSDSAGSV